MKLQNLYETLTILLEAKKYDQMFSDEWFKWYEFINGARTTAEHKKKELKEFIKRTKQVFKKEDRIIWFLKHKKREHLAWLSHVKNTPSIFRKFEEKGVEKEFLDFVEREFKKWNKKNKLKLKSTDVESKIKDIYYLDDALREFEHFFSLGISKIDDYVFDDKTYSKITIDFRKFEEEWKEKRKRLIPDSENDGEVFLKINNDWIWFDLERPYCSQEADAMGHCGNQPAFDDTNQTILSLRERIVDNNQVWWKPHLTFIYHKREKGLGEMKGFGNEKPSEKYHKYIIPLLEDERIQQIIGGGYLPESNFSLSDLPKEQMKKLIEKKPTLLSFPEHLRIFGFDEGMKEALKKKSSLTDDGKSYVWGKKNLEDFIDDFGNDTAKWIYQVLHEGEYVKQEVQLSEEVFDNIASTVQYSKLKEYIEKKYPDKVKETDWFEVLETEENELFSSIIQVFDDANRFGIEQSMIEYFDSALEGGMSYDRIIVYPEPDSLIEIWKNNNTLTLTVPLDSDFRDFILEYADDATWQDFHDYIDDALNEIYFNFEVSEPQYGFDGFDEEYFREELDTILKDLK